MAENPYETRKKDHERVEKKIANNENLDELDEDGLAELHKAIMNTDIYSIRKLLEAGAGINVKETKSEWTPLMFATQQHDYKIMEILLSHGANVNEVELDGRSALHLAIGRGIGPGMELVKLVKILLDHGSDVNTKDDGGIRMSPVDLTLQRGNPDILGLLIENGAIVQSSFCSMGPPIFLLLMSDVYYSARCIDLLLSVGVDINGLYEDLYTPLMYAAALGRKGSLLHLLKRNADIAFINRDNDSALTLAVDGIQSLDEEDSAEYTHDTSVQLCFVAGGVPPSREFTEVHLSEFQDNHPVPELRQLCRNTIRSYLLQMNPPGNLFTYVPKLNLPSALTAYLLYGMSLEDFPEETLDEYYARRLAQALT